jgi:hypothetical protein
LAPPPYKWGNFALDKFRVDKFVKRDFKKKCSTGCPVNSFGTIYFVSYICPNMMALKKKTIIPGLKKTSKIFIYKNYLLQKKLSAMKYTPHSNEFFQSLSSIEKMSSFYPCRRKGKIVINRRVSKIANDKGVSSTREKGKDFNF